jgi:hypothetical protein
MLGLRALHLKQTCAATFGKVLVTSELASKTRSSAILRNASER